ncbi:MAG: phosphatase PAP2 family protein [Candidatus Hodarchaeota archaeon]
MNDTEILSKKTIGFVLVNTLVISLVGIILLVLGLNDTINEFFYDNEITFAIFSMITQLGWYAALIVVVVTVLCVYDVRIAKNLLNSVVGSYYINSLIKDFIQDPTPWTRREEPGFGFPSGHAQNSVASYGYLSYHAYKKKRIYISWIFLVIVYLITISRVIIGSHDVDDVIGGLLFGITFLLAYIYLEPIFSEKLKTLNFSLKIILSIVIPVLLFIIAILVFPSTDNHYGIIGAIIGSSVGYLIEIDKVKYNPSELNNKQKIINLLIGLVIVLGLYVLLVYVVPIDHIVWEFFVYIILSLIGFLFVPWIFIKIKR